MDDRHYANLAAILAVIMLVAVWGTYLLLSSCIAE